ncbi:bacillithiol biosynthesis cysteine-adding enzyme BshC [Polaribacter sp. IC066]|uniref:bacillithiol biosynthesis cysteine-adding enzyme BshC n=1 Tax=Polaribacter sp. IC066 TaxID=57032 RepID=UPI0011BEDA3D|nr:bacillithiol biosynthesis cysteine-adding enzyme BshC [Polaribacter sp. IC066]TXD57903.1 bacillithiol biosynthesis cysteine-adding enzyme BshC [Polaribacter sp. IC066]
MKVTHIPFQKTGFFSKTMADYLEKSDQIKPFYHNFPDINGFHNQIEEKRTSFRLQTRLVLVDALKKQYQPFNTSEKTAQNIALLKQQNTFTITTGHQLNLFTGPLYFLYKIISTINLSEELADKFPEENFVPIYWMATEDHDFDEINYFNFDGKKVSWNRNDGGAVGRFSTEGLEDVFEVFSNHLGNSKNAEYLKNLFSEGYLKHDNLADATRFIANELFKEYGLVIIDGDDKKLKQLFTPFVKDELEYETSFKEVSKTILELEKNYPIQVNPREINLFYLSDDYRERIIFENNLFKVNNTNITFSKAEILKEADENPLAFSPNVIMRPLFQEAILPNLCYIGGGGEMAYWLQLKDYFEKVKVPFPILLLRNSVQVISDKQARKLSKLNITEEEVFLNQFDLLSKKVISNSALEISFDDKKQFLQAQFVDLKKVAKKTDVTFVNAVNAQERKQLKGLENLEKRLLKAEKKRQQDLVDRITLLQNELLPNESLEERQRNFSEYYLEYGTSYITNLKDALKPLQLEFTIITL